MLKIKCAEKGGIGRELHLKTGYSVIDFDGYPANDLIDYLYFDGQEKFTMRVADRKGRESVCEIEKDEDETLGLTFEDDGMEIRTCRNKCIFCFVDQMPKGMRDTLYVKDDDYRQSFLVGNFVTLTNISEYDADRIIRYKLSPLYISIHTMNADLRAKMMGNRFAGRTIDHVKRFAKAGIEMHAQIVLVPGVNDGAELDYSARELFKLYPAVKTLAVVPCGITKYREGLYPIADAAPEYCGGIIEQADRLNGEFGQNFVTLADEFYFKANRPVKPYEFYDEFPQIENGVGMTAKFYRELSEAMEERERDRSLLIVTGTSAEGFIRECAKMVEEHCKCLKTHVIGVVNEFFGSTVNCSGLLVGQDILRACRGFSEPYDEIVIPSDMLKEFEDVFLDGMTVSQLERETGKPVRITGGSGESFFNALTSVNYKNRS